MHYLLSASLRGVLTFKRVARRLSDRLTHAPGLTRSPRSQVSSVDPLTFNRPAAHGVAGRRKPDRGRARVPSSHTFCMSATHQQDPDTPAAIAQTDNSQITPTPGDRTPRRVLPAHETDDAPPGRGAPRRGVRPASARHRTLCSHDRRCCALRFTHAPFHEVMSHSPRRCSFHEMSPRLPGDVSVALCKSIVHARRTRSVHTCTTPRRQRGPRRINDKAVRPCVCPAGPRARVRYSILSHIRPFILQ